MNTSPLDRINAYFDVFTNTDKEIAEYILKNPRKAATSSADDLAEFTGASKSALIRFSKKIGYSGYSEMKFDLSRLLVSENKHSNEDYKNVDSPVASIIDTYAKYIRKIQETCTQEDLEYIARKIVNANRIRITGINRTFNSALQFSQRLLKLGIDSQASSDCGTLSDLVQLSNEKDLLIVFTIQDRYKTHYKTVNEAVTRNCPVILFTMNKDFPYADICDKVIYLPWISTDSDISFLDDQAIFFVFIEILLSVIASITYTKD